MTLIFLLENEKINKLKLFTIESLISDKIRLVLSLFWRDIASNLNKDTVFKLQLKLNFNLPDKSENENQRNTGQIRSIGLVKVYTKNNFNEALTYFKSSLFFIVDNYITLDISKIILVYNICHDESLLKTLDISSQNFNNIEQNLKNNYIEAKPKLKLNDKNYP